MMRQEIECLYGALWDGRHGRRKLQVNGEACTTRYRPDCALLPHHALPTLPTYQGEVPRQAYHAAHPHHNSTTTGDLQCPTGVHQPGGGRCVTGPLPFPPSLQRGPDLSVGPWTASLSCLSPRPTRWPSVVEAEHPSPVQHARAHAYPAAPLILYPCRSGSVAIALCRIIVDPFFRARLRQMLSESFIPGAA